MALFYIHPELPTRSFGRVETDSSILIAELYLDQDAKLKIHVESFAPLLAPLLEESLLGLEEEAWSKEFRKFGLVMVKQKR